MAFDVCSEGLFEEACALDENNSLQSSPLSGSGELANRSLNLCGCLVAMADDSSLDDLASVPFALVEDGCFLLAPSLKRSSTLKRSSLLGKQAPSAEG